MLYTFVIIILVIVVILRSVLVHRRSLKIRNTYTWLEILYPFNSAPKQIYNHLSPENKGAFWSIFSSVIIGVLSCWLGFSLQYFVYNSTQNESTKLVHYQVVDKFQPIYLNMYDSISSIVFEEFYRATSYGTKDGFNNLNEDYLKKIDGAFNSDKSQLEAGFEDSYLRLLAFIVDEQNWNNIDYAIHKCINVSSSIAPYLDSESCSKLMSNNTLMVINSQIFQSLQDSIVYDSISFVQKNMDEYIKLCVKGEVSIQSNLKDIYGVGYSLYHNYLKYYNGNSEGSLKLSIASQSIKLGLVPMLTNIIIIKDVFSPKSIEVNKSMWMSLIFLVLCVFIGYMLFRIILMKFFDRKSLEPNPRLSQIDLEKHRRELNAYKRDAVQTEANLYAQSVQITNLQKDLDEAIKMLRSKEKIISELQEENKEYCREVAVLKEQITNLRK